MQHLPKTKTLFLFLLLSSAFVLTALVANAQSKKNPKPQKVLPNCYVSPTIRSVDPTQKFSGTNFHSIMNKTFGSIATGQATALSTYGSFDPVAGNFALNYFQNLDFVAKKKDDSQKQNNCDAHVKNDKPGKSWYLMVSAAGNIIGGNTGVLFNNSKFNSGSNVTSKLYIPLGKNSIVYDEADADRIRDKKVTLEYQRWSEKNKIWNTVNTNHIENLINNIKIKKTKERNELEILGSDSAELAKKIIQLSASKIPEGEDSIEKKIKKIATLSDSLLKVSAEIDSLQRNLILLVLRQDSLTKISSIVGWDATHEGIAPYPELAQYGQQLYNSIDRKYDSLSDSVELTIPYHPYNLKWLTLVGSYAASSYYTYFDSLPFAKQIQKNNLSVFNYGLEFNLLHAGISHSHYLNIGLLRIRNNNIGDLSTSTISRQVKTSENDSSLTGTQNYNAYVSLVTEYEAWKIYINYYFFVDKSNKQAIHFIEESEFRNTKQSPTNAGIGYVFSFKNSKDNSVINVEAYIKLLDIFRSLPDQEVKFYNRNIIGLQFGVPVNISGNKKS